MDTINLLLFSSYAFFMVRHGKEYVYLPSSRAKPMFKSLNSCMLTRGFIPNPPISSSRKDIKFQEVI